MKAIAMLPFWILMALIAFPLVSVSIAAVHSAVYAAATESQENNDPIVFAHNTVWCGPFAITTNARGWAGACVLIGIAVTTIGLIGLFHFPAPSSLQYPTVVEQPATAIK